MKEHKEKRYSLWGNLKLSFRLCEKYEGGRIYAFIAINAILGAINPFLAVFLPSLAVSLLTGDENPLAIIGILMGYIIGLQLLQILYEDTNYKNLMDTFLLRVEMDECQEHVLSMDYEKLESQEGQKKMDAATRAFHWGDNIGIEAFILQVPALLKNILGLAIYSVVAGRINPLILLYMLVSTAFVSYLNWRASQWEHNHSDERQKIFAKKRYLDSETIDSKNMKDIKLYGMQKWFMDAYKDIIGSLIRITKRSRRNYLGAKVVDVMLAAIRDGIVYVYLINRLVNGNMEVDTFILMLGVIAGFGTWMNGIVEASRELWNNSIVMSEYQEFMNYGSDKEPDGGFTAVPNQGCAHEIKLDHVSYVYPGADKPSLRDVSLTIHKGEKLALVGINGAGKSTLVKLIAGLYHPTTGTITIDGIDITKLHTEEYHKEMSVVFQEVFAFAFPLDSNVTGQEERLRDAERLDRCLKQADIWEKVQQLPDKTHTMLMKDLDQKGIVLSGGEMQRLMLARALYKDAPMVMLDEPTSALDPIAESQMYEKYNSFAENKTSVFISHRLSSTRFCDRIIFMDGGAIVEEGTHEALMEQNGKYADMFNIQAHYYNEDMSQDKPEKGDVCYE